LDAPFRRMRISAVIPRTFALLGASLAIALASSPGPLEAQEPPNPMQTKAPIGSPDFWPWDAAGVFKRDEATATSLVVFVDGDRCVTFSPQDIATDAPGSPLALLNRAYHDYQRNHLRWDDPLRSIAGQRHRVQVIGYDSGGRRSQTVFFTPITVGDYGSPLSCDALRH